MHGAIEFLSHLNDVRFRFDLSDSITFFAARRHMSFLLSNVQFLKMKNEF